MERGKTLYQAALEMMLFMAMRLVHIMLPDMYLDIPGLKGVREMTRSTVGMHIV